MKPTFFVIGKKAIFAQKIWDPSNSLHVALAFIFSVNQDVIQADNNKNIEFFGQNLIDVALEVALEAGRSFE